MKLASFAVKRFRSITTTSKLPIKESLTIIVGPNNEGKSNVLRALVTALEIASKLDSASLGRHGRLRIHQYREKAYDWATDFPVSLQAKHPDGESEFDFEFKLTADEVAQFRTEVGSSLNGNLPIRLRIGKGAPSFSVRKRGPGAARLSAKASRIARFIGRRIGYEHIPAVRPAEAAMDVVQDILERELRALNSDPNYVNAVQEIERLQQPVLRSISDSVRDTLRVFLPNVVDVQVNVPRDARYRAFSRSCEIIVDDGTPTALTRKGDGVQSLAALSLMRHASQSGAKEKQLILAIEEPESHLHPNAIHELKNVLRDIARQHQVIITTHCPLFVDRNDARANILVTANRASPAASIRQIRETMGVKTSDNLAAAEVLLIVEGESDRIALQALLSANSKKIASALRSGILGVDSMSGGSNLSYKLSQAKLTMCKVHCLLDNDTGGQQAAERAQQEGLLSAADFNVTSCLGMGQSELEDWYDSAVYVGKLAEEFGVPTVDKRYTAVNRKWSDRIREVFLNAGRMWSDQVQVRVKSLVAEAVLQNPAQALHPARRAAFDNLVSALERRITSS